MKLWLFLGVILTVLGLLLVWNGIEQRLAGDLKEQEFSTKENLESIDLFDLHPSQEVSLASSSTKPSAGITAQNKSETINKQDIVISSGKDDNHKNVLLEILQSSDWSDEEIVDLAGYLNDPRTVFLHREIEKNARHKETADLYTHNLNQESLDLCMKYLDANSDPIRSGAQKYDVPVSVVLAIIKVETNLGRNLGKRSVFNVFWSLGIIDHPQIMAEFNDERDLNAKQKKKLYRRAKWARKELRDLIYMGRHGGENPVGIMGSWAGAFGLGQFIPSSYRAYGRDGDGDGVVDMDNIADASASVANYFKENGWRNSSNLQRKKKVIMRYNISEPYADCILELSGLIEKRMRAMPEVR